MADNELLTKAKVAELVDEKVKAINLLLTGVVIVLFIGFATIFLGIAGFIVDAYRFRHDTHQDLIDRIDKQNQRIGAFIQK